MTQPDPDRLARLIDQTEIRDLVRRERFARDQRHWEVMRDCFHPEAWIRTSWYDGSATDYIPATQKMMEASPYGKHWVFPGFITIHGDRATVESPALIFNRLVLNGTEVDYQVYCRFHSRVQRLDGEWKLMSFHVIWERDIIRTLDPRTPLPFDWDEIATYRPTYRFLTWIQTSRGYTVNPDLLGDDRPEALAAFHAGENAWLRGEAG